MKQLHRKSWVFALSAAWLVAAGCSKPVANPEAAAVGGAEAAAKAGEAAAVAGAEAAAKAGEAAAKAGEAAAAAGEAAAAAGAIAAAKAGEAAALAGEAAGKAGAAAAAAAAGATGEAVAQAGAAAEAAGAAAGAAAGTAAVAATDFAAALLDPSKATAAAPASYKVRFTTTKGPFDVRVTRDWGPRGADRLYNLVKAGFFTDVAYFRVISGFMVQFGIHGDPKVATAWRDAEIADDPVKEANTRGRLTFATRGPNSRTTQLFINFGDNRQLDGMGFTPIGEVDGDGMKVVDSLHAGYGEGAPRGAGPDQMRMQMQGNAYLKAEFGKLDYIQKAEIVE